MAMETYQSLIEMIRTAGEAERDEALGKLIRQFEDAAYRWAFELLHDSHWAQDAVQEAFITAYEHLDQLKDPAAFPGWLKRIVQSQCGRIARRRHFVSDTLDDSADSAQPDPSEEVEERESKEQIEQALTRLSERERTVTELFYLADYSQPEIAERLAVPVTTVKKRLQYARKHLRTEYLKDHQHPFEPVDLLSALEPISLDDEDAYFFPEDDEPGPVTIQSIVVPPGGIPALAGSAWDYGLPLYGGPAFETAR